ncbi:hypothetical protein [Bacteroides gallinarum]|uniref:hypothetical protein n=1 Tax=Bacteroides gallinarum TaxID=376806 RepID=UPI00038028AB|nr:hypothetical protein [Bacteroides gallinarum]
MTAGKGNTGYAKCYRGLYRAFEPHEVIFMLYMNDLAYLRQQGYDTLRSKRLHRLHTNIGPRAFDHCVEKTTAMGLLVRVPANGMFDYLWDRRQYERLVEIVTSTASIVALQEFCNRVFSVERRTVSSVTDREIQLLAGNRNGRAEK